MGIAAATMAIVGIVAVVVTQRGGEPAIEPTPPQAPGTVAAAPAAPPVEPPSVDEVIVPEGLFATAAAWDGWRFWVLAPAGPETGEPRERALLLSVDPATGEAVSELALGDAPTLVAAGGEGVWVAHWGSGAVSRIDPTSGAVLEVSEPQLPEPVGARGDTRMIPSDLVVAEGSVWMLTARGAVAQLDAASGRLMAVHAIGHTVPSGMAVDAGGVWITQSAGDPLVRLDPGSGTVEPVIDERIHQAHLVAVESGIVLAAGDADPESEDASVMLTVLDPASGLVTPGIPLPDLVVGFVRIEDEFGLLDQTGAFYAIDPVQATVAAPFRTNWSGEQLFDAGGETWMVDGRRLRRLAITGEFPPPLPVAIPEQSELRPVPPELAWSPDWEPLGEHPSPARWPAVVAWTGEEIVVWGGEPVGGGDHMNTGAAYNPVTDSWREMAPAPVPSFGQSQASWVWTGEELVVWTRNAHAWNPETNTWRTVEDWPLQAVDYRRAVWTGEEIIDVDRELAVDPKTGASRPIAEPPSGFNRQTSVVFGQGLVVPVPRGPVYDAAADRWIENEGSRLSPNASSGVWTGDRLVAVDYEMDAAAYDPDADEWAPIADVPLRFFECSPRAHAVRGMVLVEHCGQYALLDVTDQWLTLAPSTAESPSAWTVSTADSVYTWSGSGFARLRPAALEGDIRRRMVNTSVLDVPESWRVVSTGVREQWIQLDLLTDQGLRCVVVGAHVDAESTLRGYPAESAEVVTFTPIVGGAPVEAMLVPDDGTALSAGVHLVWAAGGSDIHDVSCPTRELALELAAHVWSPWQ